MPTIDIPDRICSHCGGTSWKIEYRKKPTKANPDNKYIRYRCSTRGYERYRKWYINNPEKVKLYWKPKQPEYYRTSKYLAKARIKNKNNSNSLTDYYIKYLFRKDIRNRNYILTPEEIEMYRIHLTIERKLKQL